VVCHGDNWGGEKRKREVLKPNGSMNVHLRKISPEKRGSGRGNSEHLTGPARDAGKGSGGRTKERISAVQVTNPY